MANFGSSGVPRYEFDTKQRQSVQLNSYNWRNFDYVTASKAGWRKDRHVTVTEGCRFELNSTVVAMMMIGKQMWKPSHSLRTLGKDLGVKPKSMREATSAKEQSAADVFYLEVARQAEKVIGKIFVRWVQTQQVNTRKLRVL